MLFYCIQCRDKISGRTGDFVYDHEKPFEAISPVYDDVIGVFNWMRQHNFEMDPSAPMKLKVAVEKPKKGGV